MQIKALFAAFGLITLAATNPIDTSEYNTIDAFALAPAQSVSNGGDGFCESKYDVFSNEYLIGGDNDADEGEVKNTMRKCGVMNHWQYWRPRKLLSIP